MSIAPLCGMINLTTRIWIRSLGTILGMCWAPKTTRPMGQLPFIVSYILISLKECSTLYSILTHTHTHTHTNMHLKINMASNILKPNIHLSCLSTKPSIHLSWRLIQGNNKSRQQVCMAEHVHTHHQIYT